MRIKNVRKPFWISTAALLFFFLCDGLISQKLFGFFGVLLLILWFACGFALGLYPCPTCGEPFFSKRFVWKNIFERRSDSCKNCGYHLHSA